MEREQHMKETGMAVGGVGAGSPAMMAYVQGAGGMDPASQTRKSDDAAAVQKQQVTKAAEVAAKAPPKPTGNIIDVAA